MTVLFILWLGNKYFTRKGRLCELTYIVNGVIVLLVFLLIYRKKSKSVVELLSLLWLKSIVVVVVLYFIQLFTSTYGIFIPINLFTVSVMVIFNIPGLVGLTVLYKLI